MHTLYNVACADLLMNPDRTS